MKRKTPDSLAELDIAAGNGNLTLRFSGPLSAKTAGVVWEKAIESVKELKPRQLNLDFSKLDYCDMAGISLIRELKNFQKSSNAVFQMEGLRPEYQKLFDLANQRSQAQAGQETVLESNPHPLDIFGRSIAAFFYDLYEQTVFVGEVVVQLGKVLTKPRSIRWKDVWAFVELHGVNATGLIILIGTLVGAILGFQSVIPLRSMGADVFVASIVGFAILRELGPLMTAIILAGRTGSAIAAEIGTMTVNEEVNAIKTMGLEPVRFLVISRLLGILFLAPFLTIVADFFGMVGGGIVYTGIGYPLATYLDQIKTMVKLKDIFGGVLKAFPFAIAVAGIGCLRGLQTKTGASAVGKSTTSAVVSGIVLIIILDSIISAIYYAMRF